MNKNLETIIDRIQREFDFIGTIVDNKTKEEFEYVSYSITVQLLSTWVEQVQVRFPDFSVSNLYNNYFIIGFNKTK